MSFEENVLVAIKELETDKKSEVRVKGIDFNLKKSGKEEYILVPIERQLMYPQFRFLNQEKTVNGLKLTLPSMDECNSMAKEFDDESKESLNHLKTYSGDELLYKLGVGILLQPK